jgi:hypothetical protein
MAGIVQTGQIPSIQSSRHAANGFAGLRILQRPARYLPVALDGLPVRVPNVP